MASVAKGTRIYIATAFGSVQNTTVVSNAAEAIVTCNAHGYDVGDIVEMTSGWGRLNKRVARIKAKDTNTFTLEGINTVSTDFFPAGSGIGSVREITTWVQVTKVLDITPTGGAPRNTAYDYLEDDVEYSINEGFEAVNNTLAIDSDAVGSAGYVALQSLTDVQTDTCMNIVSRGGQKEYQPCKVALNEAVQRQRGQINRVIATLNGNGRLTRYAT